MADQCFICRKHRGEELVPGGAIYEDELVFASHALRPGAASAYRGWLVVETKRHASHIPDLTDEEAERVGLIAVRVARALRESEGAEWIYSATIGHNNPHFHLHLLPRYPGTPREWWGLQLDEWPDAPTGAPEELAEIAGRIRAQLAS